MTSLHRAASRACAAALPLLALACAPAWALYKVVGPDGKITYTDRAPTEQGAQAMRGNGAVSSADALPFALRQVAQKFPVTLYTAKSCSGCDLGRTALRQRGIPYVEKTVSNLRDAQELQRREGTTQLPVLRIGNQQLIGYASADWQSYLDAAGYPAQSALPRTYSWAEPTPLVPAAAASPGSSPEAAASRPTRGSNTGATTPPAPAVAPPPGIRF